jgi:hypothetical protein
MSVEHVGVRGRKRLDDNWSLGPSRELAQQTFGPARELVQQATDPARELAHQVSGPSLELAHQASGPSQELAQPVLGHFREFTCDSSGIFRCILFKNLYCATFSRSSLSSFIIVYVKNVFIIF